MSLSLVQSRALLGLEAPPVTVEVHLAHGLPSFTLVGLADVEVKEARERVRAALANSGFDFPNNRRITVNLAPADLPKDSGRFDLPIALGILAADGQIDAARLAGHEFAGELSLSGELRPVRGALAMALAARRAGAATRLVLPLPSAQEAARVPDSQVYGAARLQDVVIQFLPAGAPPPEGSGWCRIEPTHEATPAPAGPDLRDVRGQVGPRRALEIAAAGGHSLLLVGPPGSGKSMLAQRLAGLLPAMTLDEALESAAIRDLAGRFDASRWAERPTQSPHHTASAVALVGGGSPPRPGEISLAHHGVLYLDELPEFPRAALEALREPLETGGISISRAARRSDFPARFQLIAAMNPCPCGYLGAAGPRACRCTPDQVARYQARLSGPLLDRIDLHIEVPAVRPDALLQAPPGEATAEVRARCALARERALARQGVPNHRLEGESLDQHARLAPGADDFLRHAATRLGWSARAMHRLMRVARTIADLAGSEHTDTEHLAEAIQCRRALVHPA